MLVTHEPDVAAVCDRIIRMRDGKIREETRPSEPVVPATVGVPKTTEDRELVLTR